MEENSPLILQTVSRNGETSLNMPSTPGSDLLTFRTGEAVSLACPDVNDNKFVIQNTPFMERELTAVCKKGKNLLLLPEPNNVFCLNTLFLFRFFKDCFSTAF
jgi:hypothetical protein